MNPFSSGFLPIAFLIAAASSIATAWADPVPKETTGAAAESALEKGDCRVASETYAALARQTADPVVARRASEVALGCEHLPAAWEAVTRWRSLAPSDRDAAAFYATVALKLYRVSEARAALATALQVKPEDANDDTKKDLRFVELTVLFMQNQVDASALFAAVRDALEVRTAKSISLAVVAGLALPAYNTKDAQHFIGLALKRDPKSFEAKNIQARMYVMRGDSARAIATARETAKLEPEKGEFELADILTALERPEEARLELDRLHSTDAPQSEIDRRLALLAFQGGDLREAQHRYTDLAKSGAGNDTVLLQLADIAKQDGDTESALAGYRRLFPTAALALTARIRAATLLMDKKERGEAFALLDDYAAEHPDQNLELTITKANLLADHGDIHTGIALLETALDRYPRHPSLQYARAALLEQSGKVKEAVAALEHVLGERPDDPMLMNALGYTLADHGLELARAEKLIRKSLSVMPDNPAVLDSLGWVRFKRGDSKGAIGYLKRAYARTHDAEIAGHWAEVLWASGARQEARAILATALARTPDSEKLKKAAKRLALPSKA